MIDMIGLNQEKINIQITWSFDPSVFLPTDEKKIVIWRPIL
jgi:hypothetical protein